MSASWPKLNDIAVRVGAGELSAVELVERALAKAKESAEYDSLISLSEERARLRAAAIDKKIAAGESGGRLAGVPFIAKDNFLTYGGKTTAASNILKPFEAPYQATAINRLEAEGAILIGKSNLDAFAHGASTENSDFFTTKNPHDKTRVPGGSSGGSAAAVALGIVPFALGTDTGGSIRQPAGFCGVVGYKPTYGLVSRSGVIAMASSTDVIGPIAATVEDAALVLDIMAAKDKLDGTTIDRQESYLAAANLNLSGMKVGVVKEYMSEDLEPGVKSTILRSLDQLKKAGAVVEEISLPSVTLSLAVYYIICPAEVSSNLARYDGQRYGYSAKNAENLEESYELSREQGFGPEAKRRIMIGAHVLSSGYYEAYYKKAQTVRTKIINELEQAFEKYDFLAGPVSPTTAFKIGEKSKDPLQMYLADIMTVAANISGIPAISIPAGASDGLPVGFQVMAPQRKDQELLAASRAFEEAIR